MTERVIFTRIRLYWLRALFAVFFVATLALMVVVPQAAHAGGGVGGGGSGGGGGGGAQSKYGWGWHVFGSAVGSSTPGGVRNGQQWSDIQRTCRDGNASTVIAFIIFSSRRTVATSVVYSYARPLGSGYLGGNGGLWETTATAQGQFNSLPSYGVDTSGFRFGDQGPAPSQAGNVAWFCYNYQPTWSVSVSASVDKPTALPGDTVTWTHSVKNAGPATSANISYGYNATGGPFGPTAIGNGGTASQTSTYVVSQADVGNNVCRATYAQPKSGSDGGVIASSSACVGVSYSYTLVPEISNITDGGVTEGAIGVVPVQAQVSNTGNTKSHTDIQWQVTQVEYGPGKAMSRKAGGISPSDPCAYFVGNTQCGNVGSGTEAVGYAYRDVKPYSANGNLGDEPVGTHLCYAMSVKRNSSASTDWKHSQLYCLIVGKKPKVQVHGGDLSVGQIFNGNTSVVPSAVDTSISVKTIGAAPAKTFGSWVEYGIFATGSIAGMGSGSAFAGSGLSTAGLCDYSTLSFSNTDVGASACTSSSKIGYYQSNQSMPNIAASFPVTAITPSLGNNPTINMNGGNPQGLYTATGNVSISGGVNKGQWFVLNAPTANVTITGNMNYTNATLHSIQDIPQVVIIAKNITIADNVTNVDAWLIANGGNSPADGKLNTCGAVGAPAVSLVVAQCNQLLTVNGPVMAQRLYLNRTGGSGTGPTSGDPAEIFNLRPDAYLWGYARATSNGQVQTVYSNELPPRF